MSPKTPPQWPARAVELILNRRRLIAAALLLITVGLLAGLPGLRFDFSPQAFFETGDDDDRYQQSMVEQFGHADDLVMLIVSSPEGVLRRPALDYVDEITALFDAEPWVGRSQGLTTAPIVQPPAEEFDPILIEPLSVDGLIARGPALKADPLVGGVLINPDATATAVWVEVDARYRKVSELAPLMARLDDLLAAHPPPPGVTVQPYGLPHLRVTAVDMLITDQFTRLPIVMVLFIGVLYLLFARRWLAVMAPFVSIVLVILWVPGLMGHLGTPINLLSNVLPLLLFTLGVSDAIHLMTRYAEEHARGLPGAEALRQSTIKLAGACFLTSFTTAVGFVSLWVSRTAVLRTFGLLAAAGVVFAYITTITVVPIILAKRRPLALGGEGKGGRLDRALVWLANSVVARPGRWLLGVVPFMAVLAYGITNVEIDSRIHEAFRKDSQLYQDQMQAEAALGGLLELGVSVKGDRPGRLKDPVVLQRMWTLQREIEAIDGAGRTLSPATFVRALWVAFQGAQPEPEFGPELGPELGPEMRPSPNLPQSQEALAQILLLDEMSSDPSKAGGLPWSRVLAGDWQHARITSRLTDRGSSYFLPIFDRLQARAEALFADVPGVEVRLTGEALVASRALQYYIEDLLGSLGIAALIIFGAMVLLFRSLSLGLLSIVPNMFPLLCAFGFMGLFGYPLNTTTVITFSISLGLAVDDTIHFLVRYREERRRLDRPAAVHEALIRTGRPIIMTTALLCLGVSVITTSEFLATAHFGQLVLVAVACALPGDLLVLPALLALGGQAPSGRSSAGTASSPSGADA